MTLGMAVIRAQVVLKKNDPASKPKSAGRSKWSQKKDMASDGGSSEVSSKRAKQGESHIAACIACLRCQVGFGTRMWQVWGPSLQLD